ncbi:MAG: DUF1801 domain-containing protein [Thiolinea sp.]
MTEQKTRPTSDSVADYIANIADETRRQDCQILVALMQDATQYEPVMWGTMVGFGEYHYQYASGHQGDAFLSGFAARKNDLTIYIVDGFEPYADLLARLGRFKHSKSCLYVKRLADIDLEVLRELVERSVKAMKQAYPAD